MKIKFIDFRNSKTVWYRIAGSGINHARSTTLPIIVQQLVQQRAASLGTGPVELAEHLSPKGAEDLPDVSTELGEGGLLLALLLPLPLLILLPVLLTIVLVVILRPVIVLPW